MNITSKTLAYVGANIAYGQQKSGTEDAYHWLKLRGLQASLEKSYEKVFDAGAVEQFSLTQEDQKFSREFPFKAPHFPSIASFNKRLALYNKELLDTQHTVLTIGGDHSCALGTISASLAYNPDTKIIWVDAHADFNHPEISPSGNLHGMPLSFLTRYYEHELTTPYLDWMGKLDPKNIVLIGIRDLDKKEAQIIKELGVSYFSAQHVAKLGIAEVMKKALYQLDPHHKSHFHLSFDVDGIDPKFFPSTGTPVHQGLHLLEGQYIFNHLHQTGRLQAMDLVEINPRIGNKKDLDTTLNSTFSLFESMTKYTNKINNLAI